MKKIATITALAAVSMSVFAEFEMNLTKQQFIDQQIKLFEYVDQLKTQNPELESEFNIEQDNVVANCLGLSNAQVKELEAKVTGSLLIAGVKSCSSKLPDNITLKDADWSKSPSLADFNACNEAFIVKKMGVSLDKFKKCTAESK